MILFGLQFYETHFQTPKTQKMTTWNCVGTWNLMLFVKNRDRFTRISILNIKLKSKKLI